MKWNNSARKGFSLIEITLSISLILLLGISGFWVQQKLYNSNSANETIKNINLMSSNLRSIASGNVLNVNSGDFAFFDYLVSDLYKRTTSNNYYYGDNVLFKFANYNGFIEMRILVNKNICPKIVSDLLNTSLYAIKINPITNLSTLYINPNASTPSSIKKNQYVSNNYDPSILVPECNSGVKSNLLREVDVNSDNNKYAELNIFFYP